MHVFLERLMRFARSRRGVTTLSALTAVMLVTAIVIGAMAAFASTTAETPDTRVAFDNPKLGELGRLQEVEDEITARAYPGTDIPLQATLGAQSAFNQVRARGNGNHATGSWGLMGPSTANYPTTLTFTGAPYTAAGRITALAISPACDNGNCRLWVAAAGGGIWRTDKALHSNNLQWTYVSGSFATNAIGTLIVDPTDPSGNTLYAGTGEPNTSSDSEAGLGIYKSTDGGDSWTHLASVTTTSSAANGTYTGDAFAGRSISAIVVDPTNPQTLYVSTTRGVRGINSTDAGSTSNPPTPRPPFGLFKSADGGATFTFISAAIPTIRGINDTALDPSSASIVYAAGMDAGIWRSTDGGATFSQIYSPISAGDPDRTTFAVTTLPNGKTRMYVGDGITGTGAHPPQPPAQFFRTDDATAAAPVFTNLTLSSTFHETNDYCTGQCWYDNVVVTPAGYPDTVYLAGSYQYGEIPDDQPFDFSHGTSDGRAVLYSTDAGNNFTDMTMDATSASHPNSLHPDQHALVVNPSNPTQFFEGSDGGLMRSSDTFSNISSQCAARGLTDANLAFCQHLLSRVPSQLTDLNEGLSTLQFQSLSVAADDANAVQGGTQDNGTFQTAGANSSSSQTWPQEIYGDGGQSGFNVANSALRFNTFTGQANDANFHNGDPTKWVVIGGPVFNSPESALFYPPVIADPNTATAGSIFEGSQSVWRTQDWGGDQATLEANCAELGLAGFIVPPTCGDFAQIGPTGHTSLTSSFYGSRSGGNVGALARSAGDTGTLWAATTTGRVFISKNANNSDPSTVAFTRVDTPSTPGRVVTSIYVDPANPNHAWISYSGYSAVTPTTPGHVFEVTFNGTTATFANLDGGTGPMGDLPVTSVVRDNATGDLYASTDFGVMALDNGSSTWTLAGTGMPNVEVCGLTIVPGARVLYAATHGRGAWKLILGS